jgi:tRNA pseudouridine38-40 synthase
MPRFLFTIEYLGTRFSGWQRQTNAPSIQQHVEEALERMFGQRIVLEGAGRTDAGVHALAQRAHADVPFHVPERGMILGLNTQLPDDIRIKAAHEVGEEFHCRFHAKTKTYLYQVWNAQTVSVFHKETHAFVPRPLDVAAMREAALALPGRHDFRSFTVPEPEVTSTWRTIHSVDVSDRRPRVQLRVAANGFLRYMVRRIAGLLIQVGAGALPVTAVRDALEPSFAESRWTAPANGLVLESVSYPLAGEPIPGKP